jgi:hypothetical protein
MKTLLKILLLAALTFSASAGPPEPPIPPEPDVSALPNKSLKDIQSSLDSLKSLSRLDEDLSRMSKELAKLGQALRDKHDSIRINDITIAGDSIIIILNNDSVLTFLGLRDTTRVFKDNSFVNVGTKVTVDEDQVINGDIVNIGADVIVNGHVKGSVWTLGGNIYVASTGFIRDGAIAISGKVKVDPGGRVSNLHVAFNESRPGPNESESNIYRVMAIVFLIIYFIWIILSATMSSLLKLQVGRVTEMIACCYWKSFAHGYLAYLIAFAAFIALTVTIVGIPLAFLGMPLLTMAGMILSTTALGNLIGQKILRTSDVNFRTFLWGALILFTIPGLFFLVQLLTGSLLIMIFNWIIIAGFIFMIIPLGLGAVLKTRFGTRDLALTPITPVPPIPPTPPPPPSEM